MKKLMLVFYLFGWVNYVSQAQQVPPDMLHKFDITKFTTKSGLSQNTIWYTIQDKQGFMWFATGDGLDRYDGKGFKYYTPQTSGLSSSYIREIYQAKNGIIWLGSSDTGLDRFDPKTNKFTNYPAKSTLAGTNVQSITEDQLGNLWVGTKNGLNRLTPAPNQPDSMLVQQYLPDSNKVNALSQKDVLSLCTRKDGSVWAGTTNGLNQIIMKPNGSVEFKHYFTQKNKRLGFVEAIYEDNQQRLWIGTSHDIGIFDPASRKFTSYTKGLKNNYLRCIIQDSKGIIWIGTDSGIYWFDDQRQAFIHFEDHIKGSQALYDTGVMSIWEDHAGNLWVGTIGNGAYMLNRTTQKFALYTLFLPNKTGKKTQVSCWHMVPGDSSTIWLRTLSDRLVNFNPKTDSVIEYKHRKNAPNSLSHPRVRSIYKDKDGRLWVGTVNGLDLFIPSKNHFKHYRLSNDRLNIIHHIIEGPQGRLLVNVNSKWLYQYNPVTDSFSKYLQLPRKKTRRRQINTITVTQDGTVWLGTLTGLVRLDSKNQTHTLYTESSGLKNNSVLDIYQSTDQQIWFTSYGGGLSKVVQKTEEQVEFRHYGKAQGLMNEFVYGIQEDAQGNLWMSHEKGISRFNLKTEKFTNYTITDGIQDGEFNQDSFGKRNNGQLFFGGTKGINAFHPKNIKPNPYIPPVVLTSFQLSNDSDEAAQAFDTNIGYRKKIVLNHEQAKGFSFEFAALSYANASNNQYKVKLEGYDKAWHNLNTRNFASYTNIPPGRYVFRVQGSNNDGVWNTKGLAIEIVILPAWWQTWWFKVGWISTVILLSLGFYRYRINSIKAQKRILEEKVVKRTKEVVAQKEEIHQQKEEIISRNAAITAQNEELYQQQEEIMAQRDAIEQQNNALSTQNRHIRQSIKSAKTIQEAILPFDVRMQQVLGEHFVIYRPRDVVSGDFYWLGEVNNKKVLAAIDCTGHGVPGAFMSMIGFTILNEIINAKQITDPGTILEKLRYYVRYALRQDETGGRNGMDVALITLEDVDDQHTKVAFAGAKRPLWYISQGDTELQKIKGSSISIGIIYDEERCINTKELMFKKGSLLYLCSDGFADQNNQERKKIGNQQLTKMLYQNHSLPLNTQKQILEETLDQHMVGTEQRDDILLIGLKT
ncbi:two-component regulator propeller domain-containing protein [Microscilla marina]|uniref:Ggdef domain protein, putative n=1 Tax=Microscilla marina ATCC 23134 TaxID=313606 RepID=A1ZP10_MICM2|nr:two-component regulator propeller domain-containing protein [Microscilla marina]EAY27802.1 ggdef domain protein, putative [Microscilla marina ATCC 23134]